MLSVYGSLPAAEGALFVKAVDRLASGLPGEHDQDAEGTLDQRRADALCLMASARVANDQDPDRATLVLHAPLAALGGEDNCSVAGGPALHPETSRRLGCDPRVQLVLESGEGKPLGVGSTQRVVPPWLRRLALERDCYTCTFPRMHLHALPRGPPPDPLDLGRGD